MGEIRTCRVKGSNEEQTGIKYPESCSDVPGEEHGETPRTAPPAQEVCTNSEPQDPTETALAEAIRGAAAAGQWTVVERLSAQLERHQLRRLEATADNVARLRPPKPKGTG